MKSPTVNLTRLPSGSRFSGQFKITLLASLLPFAGQMALAAVPVPSGYYQVFASDFSATTLSTFTNGAWNYQPNGGEFGYNWGLTIPNLTTRSVFIQTLVSDAVPLANYMNASIITDSGVTGKAMKFTNLQDDTSYTSISRLQPVAVLDQSIDKLFYQFKFKLSLAAKNAVQNNPGHWWDITEFHNNRNPAGTFNYRLSLYMHYDSNFTYPNNPSKWVFRTRLYDDTVGVPNPTKYQIDTPIEVVWGPNAGTTAWDTWHTFTVQVEATGNADNQGLVKAWVDDVQVVNQVNQPLGWPWANLHIFKSYIDNRAMDGTPLDFYFGDLKIYRGGAAGSVPAAPANLTATTAASPNNYRQINLSWLNVSSETGYKIERKKGVSGTFAQIDMVNPDVLTYADSTAGTGTTYYYRVRAFNASGDSGYSPESNATTAEVLDRRGHWQLDSGPTAIDSSGLGNTGTLTSGPAWATGKINGGLDFNGSTGVVGAGTGASLGNLPAITVAAWIKPDGVGENSFGRILQKGTGTGPTAGYRFLTQGSNEVSFAVDYQTTDLIRSTTSGAYANGVWAHVVATWTGSATATNVRIYLDGNEATYLPGQNGAGTRNPDGAVPFSIGNDSTQARTFDGVLDDVRVYNRVLTLDEIRAIHRAGL